jgi:hypothetical protein
MTKHKSADYKLSAVKYYLENKENQEEMASKGLNCIRKEVLMAIGY